MNTITISLEDYNELHAAAVILSRLKTAAVQPIYDSDFRDFAMFMLNVKKDKEKDA